MNANQTPRPFYRSEAFPEDVADLVQPAPTAAAAPITQRSRGTLWLLGLLPLMALAVGAALAI